MSIPHEEARRLIQFKADDPLSPANQAKLDLHLSKCSECRAYLRGLGNTESVLRRTLHRQWNTTPLPLRMDAIIKAGNIHKYPNHILAMRNVLAGFTFILFALMVWQSMSSRGVLQDSPPEMVALIPTPSMYHTATNTSTNDCQNIKYGLQEGDTLDDIARQFSVPAESILLENNLTEVSLESIRELVIPICGTTPTRTTYPPTFTVTPIFFPVVTTPPG